MTDETAPIATDTGSAMTAAELQATYEAWWAERKAQGLALQRNSRRVWAAMEGWGAVKTQEDWERVQLEAVEDWASGRALIMMLGAERYLAPERAALLLHLWRHFLAAYDVDGPAEFLTVAMALVAFNQLTRVNELVGNLEDPPRGRVLRHRGAEGAARAALRAGNADEHAGGGGNGTSAGPGSIAAARPLQPHGHPQSAAAAGAQDDATGGDGGELRASQRRAGADQPHRTARTGRGSGYNRRREYTSKTSSENDEANVKQTHLGGVSTMYR